MDLAHRQPPVLAPAPAVLAELGIGVAVGMPLPVLVMEQLQRDPGLLALGVDPHRVGQGAPALGHRGAVEPGFEDVVAEGLARRPVETGIPRPLFGGGDGTNTDAEAGRHLAVAAADHPLEPENLRDLEKRHPTRVACFAGTTLGVFWGCLAPGHSVRTSLRLAARSCVVIRTT